MRQNMDKTPYFQKWYGIGKMQLTVSGKINLADCKRTLTWLEDMKGENDVKWRKDFKEVVLVSNDLYLLYYNKLSFINDTLKAHFLLVVMPFNHII